ncbi:MAG: folylpolyglutamate synthase/dihydrofolate synthase family protein [Candidatus Omnitrophota bacterium]
MNMNYQETVDYIDSFINFERIPEYAYESSFRLDRMHAFLNELGNPHKDLKAIHIAGSKGKGSTCAMISNILRHAGYKVGLYTSPHLLDVRERIRVLGHKPQATSHKPDEFEGVIEKEEFVELVDRIKPSCERFRDHKELGRLSFFEILTALAFLYFKEKKVDYVVLETGLGGRLDATNIIVPLASGITAISMEHADKLGDSLKKIAQEKAGIVKDNGILFTVRQKKEVANVLKDSCSKKKAAYNEVGKDAVFNIIGVEGSGCSFDIKGPGYLYKGLRINLIGKHQVENAALAVSIVKHIDKYNAIKEEAIREALSNISWPGRMQVIQRGPFVILDGAQDVMSIRALLSSIKDIFTYKRLICVFGASSDKDVSGIAKALERKIDILFLTRSKNKRAFDPLYLKRYFNIKDIYLSNDVEEAIDGSLGITDKKDLVIITGSLYVVGEALDFFKRGKVYETCVS